MTLKNLFLNMMKEDIRRRLFIPAISLVMFFFWFPVTTLISFVPDAIRYSDKPVDKEEVINGMIRTFHSMCDNKGLTFVLIVLFVVAAFTGFNFNFKTNKADFLHGIPVSRKVHYLVFITDGLLMVYLPFFLMSFIGTVFMVLRTGRIDPFIILFSSLCFNLSKGILCYACAVLAVMLTGNIISAFFGLMFIFFYLTVITYSIIGMHINYFATFYAQEVVMDSLLKITSPFIYSMMDNPEDILEIILSIAVTVLLAFIIFLIAYKLYQIRAIESVGKAIAFKKAEAPIKFLLVIPAAIGGAVIFENIASIPTALFGFICALLISHCVIEVIFNSDFKKLFSRPMQMLICGAVGLVIYLGFFFDILGYDRFIPAKVMVKDTGVYCSALENNMSELNVKITKDKSKCMYGDYSSEFKDGLVKKMKITDTDTVLALARNGIEHTKKNRLSIKSLFNGNAGREQLVNPENLLICYHLKGGIKVYREYTIDGYELINELDKIHDSIEFKNASYPLLSSTEDDFVKVYCEDMTGERAINNMDERGIMLLEIYKKEFSSLTMDTRRKEAPVACLHFVNNQHEDYLYSIKTSTRHDYYEFAEKGYYPVYPSFSGTLTAIRNCGYNLNQDLMDANIFRVEVSDVRQSDGSPYILNMDNSNLDFVQPMLDCSIPNLTYKNDICHNLSTLKICFRTTDIIPIANPKGNDEYKYDVSNMSMNAEKVPDFFMDRSYLYGEYPITTGDYAYKKPDEEDIFSNDYYYNDFDYYIDEQSF